MLPRFCVRHFRRAGTFKPKAVPVRGLGSAAERRELLLKIYAPFANLDEDSSEYMDLALSGRVWEDYHQPSDSEKKGYTKLQQKYAPELREIDRSKESLERPVSLLAKNLARAYAYQSVQIEANRMKPRECVEIDGFLTSSFLGSRNVAAMSGHDLSQVALPDVSFLAPDEGKDQVRELRNHLVASYWIAEVASRNPGTAGLGEEDVQRLGALTLKDIGLGLLYATFGRRVGPGEYRSVPISVRSNPLCIFPYHLEVPACMRRFFQWRDRVHREKKLHPLIMACQIMAYFVHIHPFPDGNGRVSRMLLHDYVVRQGYLPPVPQSLDRQDYLRTIRDALDGNPEEFVASVHSNQLAMLRTFKRGSWRAAHGIYTPGSKG